MHIFIEIILSITAVFIVFSIINSAFLEFIAQLANARGIFLKRKIYRFFGNSIRDISSLPHKIYNNLLVKGTSTRYFQLPSRINIKGFVQVFMQEVFVDDTGKLQMDLQQKWKDLLPKDLSTHIRYLVDLHSTGTHSLQNLQNDLENLLDQYIAIVAKAYKRWIKFFLFLSGTFLAFLWNIDSINMYHSFKDDHLLRKEFQNIAHFLDQNKDSILLNQQKIIQYLDQNKDNLQDLQVEDLNKFILSNHLNKRFSEGITNLDIGWGKYNWKNSSFFGILLTGLALSLGASFWFDLLRKFIKL